MKQIEAIIHQFKLQEVRNALEEMGIDDFMESAILCHQKGRTMVFRGATFMANIVEKVKLEIIAADDAVASIIEAIASISNTGRREACRIAIRPYLEVA
ncbi:MAG: P-II family nitrogen regulator [Geobacteraceae bacterium]|nr:P-II family nitrogen regulator [Geobacteraceae bacterium]